MFAYPFTETEYRQKLTDEAVAQAERFEMSEGYAIRPLRIRPTIPLRVSSVVTKNQDSFYTFSELGGES